MRDDRENKDMLGDMFSGLPEAQLPSGFREEVLEKVMYEAARMKKQKERNGLFVTIALAVLIFVSGIAALMYLELPKVEVRIPDLSTLPFFAYIGGLVFILLAIDWKVRKRFYEKHSGQDS